MTPDRWALVLIFVGVAAGTAAVVLGRREWQRAREDEWDDWDERGDRLGPVTGPITITTLAPVDLGPDDEWDDATLASLHMDAQDWAVWETAQTAEEPPTDERLERVVLALTETPEAWRARVEQDNHEWRARMQTLFDGPVDFGAPLELAS